MKQAACFILLVTILYACDNKAEFAFTFDEISTPTSASIRGLSVIDEHCIWLSGSGGTVLRTTDGGENWTDCSISAEAQNDFRSIHAFDSLKAYVMGIKNPAVIYSTTNGGQSWNAMDTIKAEGIFFNSLLFSSPDKAMALSDPIDGQFLVIETKDAGNSWQKTSDMPPSLPGEGNFAASNTCIEYLPTGEAWYATGGAASRVFMTKDDGKNWQVVRTPILANEAADGIYSIAFKNTNQGIVVGGNYQHPELNDSIAAYTVNGGQSWLLAQTMPAGFRSCIQYFTNSSQSIAVAMGKTGFDYSVDNGINWMTGGKDGYYTIRSIPGTLKGFAAGSDGRFAQFSITPN